MRLSGPAPLLVVVSILAGCSKGPTAMHVGSAGGRQMLDDGAALLVAGKDGIFSQPKAGGESKLLVPGRIDAFTADAACIYWLDVETGKVSKMSRPTEAPPAPGATSSAAGPPERLKSSPPPVVLAEGQTDVTSVSHTLVADHDALYWLIGETTGEVRKVPKNGGAVQTLARVDAPDALAVDGSSVFFSSSGNPAKVERIPRDGGPVVDVAVVQGPIHALAVEGSHVYWTGIAGNDSFVGKAPKDGGKPTALASVTKATVFLDGLAVKDGNAYVTWSSRGILSSRSQLVRIDRFGRPPVVLAEEKEGALSGIVVDGTSVFVSHLAASNAILTVPR